MPPRSHARSLAVLLCLGASSCVGTPTPEPPDFLPRPTPELIDAGVGVAEGGGEVTVFPPVKVHGRAGAVWGGSDVWLVNLDALPVEPVIARANKDGSFEAEIAGAPGDRIRLISRTEQTHSLPLDFTAVRFGMSLSLRLGVEPGFDCVTITPAEELTFTGEGEIVVENTCGTDLAVDRLALRLGDQDIALGAGAASIAVGGSLRIPITSDVEGSEQAEILLLDLDDGTNVARYAIGLFARE